MALVSVPLLLSLPWLVLPPVLLALLAALILLLTLTLLVLALMVARHNAVSDLRARQWAACTTPKPSPPSNSPCGVGLLTHSQCARLWANRAQR